MAVTASAPGKLVLFGDHAAVYGKPCLVTAVDLRFSVTLEPVDDQWIEIITPDLNAQHESYRVRLADLNARNRRETAFVEAALRQFLPQVSQVQGLRIRTAGPRITYGLGSSSAVTVATMAAAAQIFDLALSPRELFDLSYAAVLDVQGTGSGIDVAAAAYGGTLYYVNRGEIIESLAVQALPLVIGYSGAKVSTTNLIAQVASLRDRQPALIDPLLIMLGDIATQARTAIEAGQWATVGDLANIHQGILDAFGVNTLSLVQLIDAARQAGAPGAKLSGAGGGDCMFALAPGDLAGVVDTAIEQAGGLPVRLATGTDGVRVESRVLSQKPK